MANIIIDFDGTVHDCAKIYVPAFYKGYKYLTDKGLAPVHEYSYDEVSSYLGFSVKDMWNKFMPDLSQEEKDICGKIIGDEMAELTYKGKSVLYNGTEQALKTLKENGHNLIFLSNCMHDYMELHRKAHNLDRFYCDFYCTEDFGFSSKPEIFTHIQKKHSGDYIIIGDRFLDLEIAAKHGLKSIGCTYGYGTNHELDKADILVSSVSELPKAVSDLC
jgi:phosphoglycolate phosphatase